MNCRGIVLVVGFNLIRTKDVYLRRFSPAPPLIVPCPYYHVYPKWLKLPCTFVQVCSKEACR